MAAGVLGHFFPDFGASLRPVSNGFIRLIRLLAAPIVFGTVVTGITRMSQPESVGRTLYKALVLFYVLSTGGGKRGDCAVASFVRPRRDAGGAGESIGAGPNHRVAAEANGET